MEAKGVAPASLNISFNSLVESDILKTCSIKNLTFRLTVWRRAIYQHEQQRAARRSSNHSSWAPLHRPAPASISGLAAAVSPYLASCFHLLPLLSPDGLQSDRT